MAEIELIEINHGLLLWMYLENSLGSVRGVRVGVGVYSRLENPGIAGGVPVHGGVGLEEFLSLLSQTIPYFHELSQTSSCLTVAVIYLNICTLKVQNL